MRPRLKEIDGILRNTFREKKTPQQTLKIQHFWRANPEATTGFEGKRKKSTFEKH